MAIYSQLLYRGKSNNVRNKTRGRRKCLLNKGKQKRKRNKK